MARTTLREYLREIEGLIDNGRNDEAIAHCRYILQFFPKHIATYRMLGKAYLEEQRYGNAADVLQRVLSCVPDDFIAHLGMSIIREDEGNLDAAIWHMERAFEVQPANAAIQEELRRLYGRRDGLEPPKVHLTRGALARMYAKGDLFQQAIAELRAALAEDPQRPDLQVLLARTYANAGQRLEAAETCSALLNKLPFCLEANQILAEILAGTERANEARAYQERVAALDPYAAHISPSAPQAERVPDSAISFERYEYTPGQAYGAASQPDWAASLGVEMGELASPQEDLPDWLSASPSGGDTGQIDKEPYPAGIGQEAGSQEDIELPEEGLPEWLRSAGWQAPHAASASLSPFEPLPEPEPEESLPGEELASAEIPDWLQALAPPESQAGTPHASDEGIEHEAAAWLAGEGADEGDVPDWLSEGAGAAGAATWLAASAGGDEPEETVTQAPTQQEPGAAGDETMPETPDWLKDLEQASGEPEFATESDRAGAEAGEQVPAWLSDEDALEPGDEEVSRLGQPEPFAPGAETFELVEDKVPEWLRDFEAVPDFEAGEAEKPSEAAGMEESQAAEQAETPDWLHGLGAFPSETEEDLEAAQAEDQSAPQALYEAEEAHQPSGFIGGPAWLSAEEAGPGSAGPMAEPPGWLNDSSAGTPEWEPAGGEREADDVPDWLRAALDEQAGDESSEGASEIPDWLRSSFPQEPEPYLGDTKPVRVRPEAAEEPAEAGAGEPEEPGAAWEGETAVPAETQIGEEEVQAEDFAAAGPAGEEAATTTELGQVPLEPQAPEVESLEPETTELEAEETETPDAETESGYTETTVLSLEDEEATMAWLESLAARQGALEEELLTSPEERTDLPPDWIQQAAEREAEAGETGAELPDWLQQAEDETGDEPLDAAAPGVEAVEDQEQEPSWMAGAERTVEEAPPDQLEPTFESSLDTGIEELEEIEIPEELRAAFTPPEEEAPVEPWASAGESAAASASTAEEAEPTADEVAAEAAVPETSFTEEEIAEMPETELEVETELPAWLREFAEPESEEPGWVPGEEPQPEQLETLDLNSASLAQLERLPGIGFVLAQNIVEYRELKGPYKGLEDLLNVPGISPEEIDSLSQWLSVQAPAEPAVEIPADQEDLPPGVSQAWKALVAGDVSGAVDRYDALIRQEQHLDRLIHDLREATFLYPQEVSLHQALGDALLRANRLEEALEAYNKAEELL